VSLFLPIAKVDEENRLVYGVATAEELDNSGEIYDYASSKPYIEAWSNGFVEKTNGQSCGNLRAMHQAISAGKIVELNFDDDQKKVEVCAKVVDDNEWQKTLEGVYTGFSFSGRAVKKWADPAAGGKRYTLKPTELSLADKPCVPSATFFDVVKVDGTVEKRKFKTPLKGSASVPKQDDVQKNMYDVSSLAQLLASLNGIRSNAVWEAQNEGDNSPVPGKLKDAIDNLAAILIEMTQEEAAELTAKLDSAGDIQKAGARNSKEDMDKIQAIHDHSVTLGASCSQQKIAKTDSAAAKNYKEDKPVGEKTETTVSKVDIENEVKKVLDPFTESIQKLSGAVEKFEKTAGTIEDLNKRLAKLEAQPEPAKAVVKTVGKEADSQVTKVDAATDALSEIKKAHNSPTWAY
jgi:flagellar motility protein MotE (MotC chaperone)